MPMACTNALGESEFAGRMSIVSANSLAPIK